MKVCSAAVLAVFIAGCSFTPAASQCELEPSRLEVLKLRTLSFLDSQRQPEGAACDEVSNFTQYLRGFGCGIHGSPAGSARPGCPDVIHGEYFVIFDPSTLEPVELVPIAH
ncbi:MAG: hypothetical protein AAGE85_04425 [Pseudomonadota bacterium]